MNGFSVPIRLKDLEIGGGKYVVDGDKAADPPRPPAPEAVAALHGAEIRPGMPVQVFARTGERSLLNYLFKPLADRLPLALEGT